MGEEMVCALQGRDKEGRVEGKPCGNCTLCRLRAAEEEVRRLQQENTELREKLQNKVSEKNE